MQKKYNEFVTLVLAVSSFFLPLPVLGVASTASAGDGVQVAEQGGVPEKTVDAKAKAEKVPGGKTKARVKSDVGAGFRNVKGNVPDYLVSDIDRAARQAGLDPSIVASQIDKESHFNAKAVSGVGAQGIAQFMPETWKRYGNGGDAFNPHDAIAAQGRYLKALAGIVAPIAARTNVGKEQLVLAAYNAGEGAVQRYHGIPPYQETQGYVHKILTDTGRYQ